MLDGEEYLCILTIKGRNISDAEYLEKYQKIYGNLTEEEQSEVLKEYHNPMSDAEYLEKYQKAYGILSEEEKIEVLKNHHNFLEMSLEEQSELVEALKDVASKIDVIEKALKEDDISFGALDDLQ